MKKFMICAIALFLLLSTSVFGDTPPGNVQSTFKKMYPKANGVDVYKRQVLNVVDAYRIMKTNGPRGRSASDVVLAKGLFISPDIVAVDTAAAKFFNQVREMPLDTVGHLANGEALKIGTMNIDKLNVKRIKM